MLKVELGVTCMDIVHVYFGLHVIFLSSLLIQLPSSNPTAQDKNKDSDGRLFMLVCGLLVGWEGAGLINILCMHAYSYIHATCLHAHTIIHTYIHAYTLHTIIYTELELWMNLKSNSRQKSIGF